MDPYNSDPFNPTAWSQVQHAMLEEDQGGHASQEGFEQHLAEARPPDPGPVSGGGRSGRNYHPHLSAEHRDIIDKAIAQYVAQKNPQRKTVNRYTQALRRLGNDLGANRITIDLGDHQSLVRYVKTYFPKDEDMKKGLGVLRAYHDPSYVTSGGRPRTIPSAEDAPLSERLSASGMKPGSAARHDRSLRRFSNALNLAGYSISGLDHATRIEFAQKLFPKDEHLLFALGKVRDDEDVSGAGASQEPSAYAVPSPTSRLYPDDARIIDGLEKAELSMLKPEDTSRKKVAQNLARNQRRFGAWLQREGRGSIVSRLTGTSEQQKSLNDDYKDFKKSSRSADMGFDRVRNYLLIVEANAALGVSPEQAGGEPRRGGSNSTWSPHLPHDFEGPAAEAVPDGSSAIYQGLDSFVDLPYTPQAVRDDAQSAPVSEAAARPPLFNGPSDAPAQSSDIFRGLQSFVDLPYTPQQMRDDAQSAQVLSPAGEPTFFVGRSGVLQELEHIGYRIHEDRQDGSQPVSDLLLDVLNNIGVLPAKFSGPTQVPISGETSSIILGPRGRSGAQFIDHPRPSPVPAAQIAPLATVASSGHRSGPVLGPTQWLGDKHIQWDYQLLAQELQQNNPDLAARTRFVDPLIAQMLRSPSKEVAERALGWVRHDTADFLFLPVSDASATDRHQRGSHWSLLLVDRRDRGRPVAYHYDSTQGYNDGPAAEIAGRLDAYVQQAPIRQQQNGYDCGVFVVDGTRKLVRRLAARRPDLNLNNLVISRQDLRDRLGADVGFN